MVNFTLFIVVNLIAYTIGFALGHSRGRISMLEDQLQEWEDSLKQLGNNNESS
jgi:hypothetical protein